MHTTNECNRPKEEAQAEDRLDDMEMWLGETPDDIKVTTEAFDREEMPESGIATGALSTDSARTLMQDEIARIEKWFAAANDARTTIDIDATLVPGAPTARSSRSTRQC